MSTVKSDKTDGYISLGHCIYIYVNFSMVPLHFQQLDFRILQKKTIKKWSLQIFTQKINAILETSKIIFILHHFKYSVSSTNDPSWSPCPTTKKKLICLPMEAATACTAKVGAANAWTLVFVLRWVYICKYKRFLEGFLPKKNQKTVYKVERIHILSSCCERVCRTDTSINHKEIFFQKKKWLGVGIYIKLRFFTLTENSKAEWI